MKKGRDGRGYFTAHVLLELLSLKAKKERKGGHNSEPPERSEKTRDKRG